jgi:hypothetical protein
VSIELSVLVHPSDLRFLEPTLRHQLRHFAPSTTITRRVVVADMAGADVDAVGRLRHLLDDLIATGLIDEVIDVDWAPTVVRASMERWFDDPEVPPRATRTRPRYQYLFSLDVAQRNLVLHLDSDVLFWGSLDWIESGPKRFDESEELLAVVPMAGPPQARTIREWILGPRVARPLWPIGPSRSDFVTTRHVLFHRERLARLCPLEVVGDEHFEVSVSRAMRSSGMHRLTTVEAESLAWHPHDHNDNHHRDLDHLIRVVEAGGYPFRRWGEPWDISTAGRRHLAWQLARARPQSLDWGATR